MRKKIFALLLLCTALTAAAKVKLPALMGDNMVLQQQADARLWGWAEAGATVRVTTSWDQQTRACRADGEGRWLLTVPTPAGSYTPYEITFDDGEPVTLRNVLVGEVWLASGQSNMEMPLRGFGGCCVQDGVDEVIAAADEYSDRPGAYRCGDVPAKKALALLADLISRNFKKIKSLEQLLLL